MSKRLFSNYPVVDLFFPTIDQWHEVWFGAGQAQARLTTYAGKMDLLKVASENVKEEIGKGIIGALEALSKDTSIEDTAIKMEKYNFF